MSNVDNAKITNEFKVDIYKSYILPSVRFILNVHELPKYYIDKLHNDTNQILKKWIGLPRCATNLVIHSKYALDIPKISNLYKESHILTHASIRHKGDELVNSVVDNKLERESACKKINNGRGWKNCTD